MKELFWKTVSREEALEVLATTDRRVSFNEPAPLGNTGYRVLLNPKRFNLRRFWKAISYAVESEIETLDYEGIICTVPLLDKGCYEHRIWLLGCENHTVYEGLTATIKMTSIGGADLLQGAVLIENACFSIFTLYRPEWADCKVRVELNGFNRCDVRGPLFSRGLKHE